MIELQHGACFRGPNPYSPEPVVLAKASVAGVEREQAVAAADAMTSVFADWFSNTVDPGLPPDLYVAEYLASWALGALNRVAGLLLAAGARRAGDGAEIWLAFHHEKLSRAALDLAASLFAGIGQGQVTAGQAQAGANELWKRCVRYHPHPSVRVLMLAARSAGIPCRQYLQERPYWQFGWGRRSLLFLESMSSEVSYLGTRLQKSKIESKRVFSLLGFPVAPHAVVRAAAQLPDAVAAVGWPCVLKPRDESQSRGVTTDIRTMDELSAAFREARKVTDGPLIVESHVPGDLHRLLVVRGELAMAVRRECPVVEGDGRSTVGELVARYNAQRAADPEATGRSGLVPTDDVYRANLARQGLTPDAVPEAGRRVRLRDIPFQRTGGVNTRVTDRVHPDTRRMAEIIAQSFDLELAGLDFICEDIGRSYLEQGALLEINTFPTLAPMVDDEQEAQALGATVLGDQVGRVPIDLVLAEPAALDALAGRLPRGDTTGWVCKGRAGIGSLRLQLSGDSPWDAVAALLGNKTLEAAVVVLTADELAREGMPVERVDRALVQQGALGEAWLEVLRRHSDTLSLFTDPSEVDFPAAAPG